MTESALLDSYMVSLLGGNRAQCRQMAATFQAEDPVRLYHELIWPAMERVEKLFRADRINTATEHMASRINRTIADQIQAKLPQSPPLGKRIIVTCADGEPEELGAQMCADLLESRGWEVYFLGGGVPNDEILTLIGQIRPDILLIFGTQPQGVPGVRRLIDMIREVGVHPTMNVMVAGGVYNRADGLWKEVNADLFARNAGQVIPLVETSKPREEVAPKPGTIKRRRRRRRAPELVAAAETT